jgi:peptidoglycan hydrolase-like protein with peptidoglycan-binding domain
MPWQFCIETRDSNDLVRLLQARLNRDYPLYSNLVVDGSYGPRTTAVVREFQRRAGLVVDGIAGSRTLGRLGLNFDQPRRCPQIRRSSTAHPVPGRRRSTDRRSTSAGASNRWAWSATSLSDNPPRDSFIPTRS